MRLIILSTVLSLIVAVNCATTSTHPKKKVPAFIRCFAVSLPILISLIVDEFTSVDYRWNFGLLFAFYIAFFLIMRKLGGRIPDRNGEDVKEG
jgi:hypothetical protein